jgi:hypothetical protein
MNERQALQLAIAALESQIILWKDSPELREKLLEATAALEGMKAQRKMFESIDEWAEADADPGGHG